MRIGKRSIEESDRDSVSSSSSAKSEDALPTASSLIAHDRSSASLPSTSASSDPMPLPVHKTQAAFVNKLYRYDPCIN
jgi:hypothetical protein